MLKVYRIEYYVAIDGGEWHEVYDGYHPYVLRDDEEPTTCNILNSITFEECHEYLQNHHLCGMHCGIDIFKRPYIRIRHNWSYDDWETYRRFKSISYKRVFKECPRVTLAEIFKHFPADQCIQYMKERGITACPMNF
jgi:hypothetical protein